MINKQKLLEMLPLIEGDYTIRAWERRDLDLLAQWPSYPFPYESLNYSYWGLMSPAERENHFQERERNPNRITLVLDHCCQKAIGYLALVEIDWQNRKVGNMALRVAPDYCDKGTGTWFLGKVSDWCLDGGFVALDLDVAASNPRAIRCYEKVGYRIRDEFWRDDERLKHFDIHLSRFDFLRPHVRFDKSVPQLRFYWMELRTP